jgi:cytochrome b561
MHWLMFILIMAVYASINLRELFPKGSDPREALKALHFMLGLSVILLLFIRIWARFSSPKPPITPPLNKLQTFLSNFLHYFLYAMMIVMPILGWLTLSASGKVIPFFGIELPALIAKNKAYAESLKEIHQTIGKIGYYVITLHVGAALFHHYIKRDNTLSRMLPEFKR